MRIHLNKKERVQMQHFMESLGAEYYDEDEDDEVWAMAA